MNEALRSSCELFINNRDAFKAAFPRDNAYLYPVCASSLTNVGRVADVEALKEYRKIIKSRVNGFSNFRGICELPLVAMLSVCDDPESRFDAALELYSELKKNFSGSEYLPVAAMILSGSVSRESFGEVAERTRSIYDLMKKEHPFLTSSEDCVFAAMLALSERGDEELIRDVEICYMTLKEKFRDKNALQSLSFVLALATDGSVSIKDVCRNTARLFDILKEKKHKYGTGYELATLGAIASLPGGVDEIARDLVEVSEFLKTQKGYGFLGYFDRSQRLLHAAMIVTSDRVGGSEPMSGAAVNSTVAMIAAQQAAICAAMTVCISASCAARAAT